jgi:hypothetical protein
MAKRNAALMSMSGRIPPDSPAWLARNEVIRLSLLVLRARQLAGEAARGLAYARSRGWPSVYAERQAARTGTRVQRLEAQLETAAEETARLVSSARSPGRAARTLLTKGQRRAA